MPGSAGTGTVIGGRRRFAAGDALRAIAALGVVLYHVDFFVRGQLGGGVLSGLDICLYLFFALSGYLIAAPFVRAYIAGTERPRLPGYAAARVLRIVPAFWMVTTVLLLVNGTFGATPGQIAAIYAFAQNYDVSTASYLVGPAWTLDIEVVFYALVPMSAIAVMWLTAGRLSRRGRLGLVLGLTGGVFVASLAARGLGPDTLEWRRGVPAMVAAFMPGVALAAIEDTAVRRLRGPAARLLPPALALLALLAAVVYTARAPIGYPSRPGAWSLLVACTFGGALLGAALTREWSGAASLRALDGGPLRWVGQRSYSLYLIHQGLALTVFTHWTSLPTGSVARWAAVLAVALGGGLVASDLCYRLVERPAMNLRGRRRARAPASPIAEAQPAPVES